MERELHFAAAKAFRSCHLLKTLRFVPSRYFPSFTSRITAMRFAGSPRPLSNSGMGTRTVSPNFTAGKIPFPRRTILSACALRLAAARRRMETADFSPSDSSMSTSDIFRFFLGCSSSSHRVSYEGNSITVPSNTSTYDFLFSSQLIRSSCVSRSSSSIACVLLTISSR